MPLITVNCVYKYMNCMIYLDQKSYESILNVVHEYISDTGQFIWAFYDSSHSNSSSIWL